MHIERIQKGETKKEPEKETYLDLFATKNLKLKERVLIPTKQYPKPYEESYPETGYEGYENYYTQQPAAADTEYYDYGHGEAQETTYESYTQDEWDNSWSGAGGKAAPARQAKGGYRDHPYGRY
uniref:KH domain containing, RNA binding, signal transduction associated 1a n=1 Tax=Takifugu rubripes TaxID=31033 RepID=A0A674MNX4_TAKRU